MEDCGTALTVTLKPIFPLQGFVAQRAGGTTGDGGWDQLMPIAEFLLLRILLLGMLLFWIFLLGVLLFWIFLLGMLLLGMLLLGILFLGMLLLGFFLGILLGINFSPLLFLSILTLVTQNAPIIP